MKSFRQLLFILFFVPATGYAQQKDVPLSTTDTSAAAFDSLVTSRQNLNYAAEQGVKFDVKTYLTLLADDFKKQATSPFRVKGNDWIKVGGYAAALGAVALVNKPVNKFAVRIHNDNSGIASASKFITRFGDDYELFVLAGALGSGIAFSKFKQTSTTLLATQAYITSVAFVTVAKYALPEQRSYFTDPLTGKKGPVFHSPFYVFKKGPDGKKPDREDYSSFPSRHAAAAFAAATVFATEYKDKPLIPILSYSAATLVALSRLTENKHWPVDIVVGATIGYLSGRQVVNNYHQYSKIKQKGKPATTSLSFNLQYANRQVIPGLVYSF